MSDIQDFGAQSIILQTERLLEIAQELGFQIRYDYFGGSGGGPCEFSGQRWLFLDLALTAHDRLDIIQEAIVSQPLLDRADLSDSERLWLGLGSNSKKHAA